MIDILYVEEDVWDHPRAQALRERFRKATVVSCARYTEVFNPRSQSFRLQKRRPALILARKHERHVLEAPPGYAVGGSRQFYFSHMLNCLYDCRYCFLQGMYRSAHYVLFVNYEDFTRAMLSELADGDETWFFSGYDCDSLALEPVTGFAGHVLPWFETHPGAWLELRTKSTQTRVLEGRDPLANVVVAFSFTPAPTSRALEHRVPSVRSRLEAMVRLQRAGWRVGLRFDPLIYEQDFRENYARLFDRVFGVLDADAIHSVSYGPFRLPRSYFKVMEKLYPEEPLLAGALVEQNGLVSYGAGREKDMMAYCGRLLADRVDPGRLYPCSDPAAGA